MVTHHRCSHSAPAAVGILTVRGRPFSVCRGGVVWEVRKGEGPVVEEEVECFLTNTRSAVGHNRENIL